MLGKDVLELIAITSTSNAIGDTIETRNYRKIYADRKSVRQSEFYQAMANGLKPSVMFQIRGAEYQNEPLLRYESKIYTILRTYEIGDFTELTCEGLVNENGNA